MNFQPFFSYNHLVILFFFVTPLSGNPVSTQAWYQIPCAGLPWPRISTTNCQGIFLIIVGAATASWCLYIMAGEIMS